MPQISVPKDFFRSERDTVYANWRMAFWRELISNSLDAGARSMTIRTRFSKAGDFRVDFADDGCGMSREIIENVYMRLGGSTKRDAEGAVGGFGRARLLTCFSHERYRIRTSDILVEGEGADYDIRTVDRRVKGTAVSVDIEGRHSHALMRGLRQVMKQSSLRVPIVMDLCREDPEAVPLTTFDDFPGWREDGQFRFSSWSHKGKHFANLEDEDGVWAHLHVSRGKTAIPNAAIVRVGGIAMYDEHIAAPVQVTVDLVPERSRDVLTASRDSIRGAFRQELQKVFSKIAADQGSTFRERSREPESHVAAAAATGMGFAMPRSSALSPRSAPDPDSSAMDRRPDLRDPSTPDMDGPAGDQQDTPARSRPREDLLRLPVAMFIDNPTTDQRAAISRYRPETWTAEGGQGRNAELLHAAWTGACRYMLEIMSKAAPDVIWSAEQKWVTGFVFDAGAEGMHKAFTGLPHGLLVNPLDNEGRQRFKLSDPASLKRLGALAAHEVAHCLHDWHDERYACLLTDLMAESSDRDLHRAMTNEMDHTRSWQKDRDALLATDNRAWAPQAADLQSPAA